MKDNLLPIELLPGISNKVHPGLMLFMHDYASQQKLPKPIHTAEKTFKLVQWRFHLSIDGRFPDPRSFEDKIDDIILHGSYDYISKAPRLNIQHPAR